MLVPLKLSSVLVVSIVTYNLDIIDYDKYREFRISEQPFVNRLPNNKSTLDYNTIDSQEYLESLIEKSFYVPVIDELQKSDAR